MPILIDGHNLIGSGIFPDINLAQEDDELQLIARLKVWRSRYRGKFIIIFDRGIPGGKDVKLGGAGVEVIFATSPTQADDLIRRRMQRKTQGLILVSNDAALRREAQIHNVECWGSADFAAKLGPPTAAVTLAQTDPGDAAHIQISADEVDEWLLLFKKKKPRRQRPPPAKKLEADKAKPSATKRNKRASNG